MKPREQTNPPSEGGVEMKKSAYKVFTHDLRSPIQGGAPVWNGDLPFTLPLVRVDDSYNECRPGWNACYEAHTALRICGLWPTGKPSRLFRLETNEPTVERGDKVRAASWVVREEILDLKPAILELSKVFGEFQGDMAREQLAWREALARPARDESKIEAGLVLALKTRGLDWGVKQYPSAREIYEASAKNCEGYSGPWGGDREAWAVRAVRGWAALTMWTTWAAWEDSVEDRAAQAAKNALGVYFAAEKKWISQPRDLLTAGIRDAYAAGLEIAIPVADNVLGWA